MDHTPFIVGSYAAAAIVLTWCALSPVLRMRRIRKDLMEREIKRQRREAAQES
jgi:heme exporter protein CcmD